MKKRWKRVFCGILAAALGLGALGALSGCSKGGQVSDYKLTYYILGTEGEDTPEILDRMNQRIQELVGVQVDFQMLTNDNYDLVVSSGEEADLFWAPDWQNYWANAAKGAFMEITDEDLQKYVPYIWENGGDTLNVTKYRGVRYGIANLRHYAPDRCFAARGDLMDKYGIASLDSMEDVEAFLTAVAENEPDMIPFDIPGTSSYLLLAMFASDWGWAPVGSLSFGESVYFHADDPEHKLFIAAEQPEMLEFTKTMKRWADKGFFSKSVLSNKTSSPDAYRSGRTALAWIDSPDLCQSLYDELSQDERSAWDTRFFTRYQKQQQMYNYTNEIVAVSAFSQHKEDALKVVNAFYSDEALHRLMLYGIEGDHYTINDDGTLNNLDPQGERRGLMDLGIHNEAFEIQSKLTFPGHEELVQKLKDMRVVNPAVNCPISDEGIREIKLALTEVYNQYTAPRYYGAITTTPEEAIQTEMSKLEAAGIESYKESIQKQLDEYLAGIGE